MESKIGHLPSPLRPESDFDLCMLEASMQLEEISGDDEPLDTGFDDPSDDAELTELTDEEVDQTRLPSRWDRPWLGGLPNDAESAAAARRGRTGYASYFSWGVPLDGNEVAPPNRILHEHHLHLLDASLQGIRHNKGHFKKCIYNSRGEETPSEASEWLSWATQLRNRMLRSRTPNPSPVEDTGR
ncbi:unnamed protein product [Durusdinium trenchii]|uniref:Uncharacterized protein n=1 Tax=Durusdinium trenchii TaxID=1381693 RepID=A0ABP0N9I2_9DINO